MLPCQDLGFWITIYFFTYSSSKSFLHFTLNVSIKLFSHCKGMVPLQKWNLFARQLTPTLMLLVLYIFLQCNSNYNEINQTSLNLKFIQKSLIFCWPRNSITKYIHYISLYFKIHNEYLHVHFFTSQMFSTHVLFVKVNS